jgi:hypothetical protein
MSLRFLLKERVEFQAVNFHLVRRQALRLTRLPIVPIVMWKTKKGGDCHLRCPTGLCRCGRSVPVFQSNLGSTQKHKQQRCRLLLRISVSVTRGTGVRVISHSRVLYANAGIQPPRLGIAPAAVGCKPMLVGDVANSQLLNLG